jgi:hypothetical protein
MMKRTLATISKNTKLQAAFDRAIEAAKKTAAGPEGIEKSFYPGSLSGKQIAKAEPALRRHITDVFRRHYKKTNDETDAWNKTLEEVGGPYAQDMPVPAWLKRHIVGALVRHVSTGVVRRSAKRAGKTEMWTVRSADAWRDREGGWTWNQSFSAGDVELPYHASTKEILNAMREQGFLSEKSRGRVRVENLGVTPETYEVQDKNTGEPLFSIESKED